MKEVDRIANDTTFNTKQILKGNPESVIQVTGDEEIEVRTIGTAVIDLPSWMAGKVDTKMERHAAYTLPQDTSGVMKKYDGINDSSKKYFADLIVHTNTSDNLLDIITKASLNNIIIDSISTINKSEYKVYRLTILVENTLKLDKFMVDLTNLPFTLKVERLLK